MARFIFEAYTYFEKKYQKLVLFFSKRKLLFLDSFFVKNTIFSSKNQNGQRLSRFFFKIDSCVMHAHSHFMDVPRTKLSFIQNSPKTTFKNFP
jgi:hypothetical protein